MSEVKYYDGKYKDIIVSIPTNAIEMTVKVKVYENGEIFDAKLTFDLEGIKYAEDLFGQCCDGKYPEYALTERGIEYLEGLLGDKVE